MKRVNVFLLLFAVGCSDALEQTSSAGQGIGVVNASDRTLSVISATEFPVTTRNWLAGNPAAPPPAPGTR